MWQHTVMLSPCHDQSSFIVRVLGLVLARIKCVKIRLSFIITSSVIIISFKTPGWVVVVAPQMTSISDVVVIIMWCISGWEAWWSPLFSKLNHGRNPLTWWFTLVINWLMKLFLETYPGQCLGQEGHSPSCIGLTLPLTWFSPSAEAVSKSDICLCLTPDRIWQKFFFL